MTTTTKRRKRRRRKKVEGTPCRANNGNCSTRQRQISRLRSQLSPCFLLQVE
jgi:hypothetical protein